MKLTQEHFDILTHTEKNGFFCGDSKEMSELCELKMMQLAGYKSFVPDPYYKLTDEGRIVLRDFNELKKQWIGKQVGA